MVVLVAGGRDFDDYDCVQEVLDQVCGWATDPGALKLVIYGDQGAGALAQRWAQAHGFGARAVVVVPETPNVVIYNHKPTQGVVFQGGSRTHQVLDALFYAGVNTWVVGAQA